MKVKRKYHAQRWLLAVTTKRPVIVDYIDINHKPSINGVKNNMKILLSIESKKMPVTTCVY